MAVITGGSKGIGAAIANDLGDAGAIVVICGRSLSSLEKTVKSLEPKDAHAVRCDVTDLASVNAAADEIIRQFGRVDILVNNAGVGGFSSPLHKLPPEDWNNILNTNLRGVFYCIRAFASKMIEAKSGHIVNISSLAGKNALPNGAAYAASKWGLNGLTYSVAEELRGHGIRVSVVCPGTVNTDLSPHEGKDKSRMLQPEDVAHAVRMLVTQAPQSFVSEVLVRPTQKP